MFSAQFAISKNNNLDNTHLKRPLINPVYKKDVKRGIENYRPTALIPRRKF